MRHRKKSRRLGRKNTHRTATLRGLARALILKESILTTKIKAREAQPLINNIVTIAKENTPESKRRVFAIVRDKALIDTVFNVIAPRFKARNGGYTRIIPTYPRRGDGASMAILEFVEKKPPAAPKKVKTKEAKKEERPKIKEEPKKEVRPKRQEPTSKKDQTKSPTKVAPEPKADVKEEIHKKKAKEEEKKVKKMGFFKNIRKYFRGKTP